MLKKIKKIVKFISRPKENYANFNLLKYHLFKAGKKTLTKYGLIKNADSAQNDMFDWSLYNLHYRGELKKDGKLYTLKLNPGDYQFINSKLEKVNRNIKPLHQNWHLIYETILQLKPESVLEVGCGNGMHLANIQTLAPEIKLYGIDRSEKQIKFLQESFPDIKAEIKVADATIPFPDNFLKVDLSFTQAVIMHMHTGESHLTALANLFDISNKYVILMERWKNHRFMDDIKRLYEQKKIKWDNLYFYYRVSAETKKPHLMICSKEQLDYPVLDNYSKLPKI